MARIVLGSLITEISGSIRGFTFQRNRSGIIIKSKNTKTKSISNKQSIALSKNYQLLAEWNRISLNDKILWSEYAQLYPRTNIWGQQKQISSLNYFQLINSNRLLSGNVIAQSPPVRNLPDSVPGYTLTINENSIIVNFDTPFTPTNQTLVIRTSSVTASLNTVSRGIFRNTLILPSQEFSTIDLTNAWITTHGLNYPPSSDYNCFNIQVQIYLIDNDSGVNSVSNIRTGHLTTFPTGVGYWSIGTDFEIQPGIGIGFMYINSSFIIE